MRTTPPSMLAEYPIYNKARKLEFYVQFYYLGWLIVDEEGETIHEGLHTDGPERFNAALQLILEDTP